MAKTSVEIDRDIAAEAAEILGTTSLRDTIHASMTEVVRLRKTRRLVDLLAEPGRFEFDEIDRAWGGDE